MRGKRLYVFAFLIRLLLSLSAWQTTIAHRPEVSSLLTSWHTLKEGYFLYSKGFSPYDGDIFYQAPILISIYHCLQLLPDFCIPLFFIGLDFLIAKGLYSISKIYQEWSAEEGKKEKEEKKTIDVFDPTTISLLYLLNPMSILTCVAFSTILFNNVAIIFAILFAMKGKNFASMFLIAFSTCLSFYPINLFPALVFLYIKGKKFKTKNENNVILSLVVHFLFLLLSFGIITGISYPLVDSINLHFKSFEFIILIPDLTPNIGVFWYFFIEIFEHFRFFFLCIFQLHTFIYTIPLSIKFKNQPMFLTYLLCGIIAIFKSTPVLGDTSLFLAFLPIFQNITKYMRVNFLVANVFLYVAFLLAPFWYFWINQGSGNANFYYGVTLAFSVGQVMLLTDSVYAYLKQKHLTLNPQDVDQELIMK